MRIVRAGILDRTAWLWAVFCIICQTVGAADESQLPEWIWAEDGSARPVSRVSLTESFQLDQVATGASFKIAADFCFAKVFINDRPVMVVEPYSETVDLDVINWMRLGSNTVRIDCEAVAGPSAVAAHLSVASGQGSSYVTTHGKWTCGAKLPAATALPGDGARIRTIGLGRVQPQLWGVGRRSAKVDATENYEQWRRAVAGKSADTFWTVPGFEITALRTAAPEEGSWVSMAFDDQGRLTIAREERGLLRMTLDGTAKSVGKVEVLNDTLLECRGLMYAHGSLYANANNTKGLYRLQDLDRDDSLEDIRLLREFPGSVGHGRNDISLGPQGEIYAIHGDSVNLPKFEINDRTSPLRDRVRGTSPGQGYVVRTDQEGKQWEILCSGLRNPFGIAVNEYGDWFTYDADAEFDMGSPWYRPTRVVQLLSGADYGWRSVTGKWPPYFPDHPDNAMPALDIGKGSPTAVWFPYAAKFPDSYRRALMILDWTYGRILAVHLVPRGAGYRGAVETFLQGKPLNVTDLAVGPDGALYLITGGRKTQSVLYRIAYVSNGQLERTSDPQSLSDTKNLRHEQACLAHAVLAKSIRTRLEAMHVRDRVASSQELDFAWLHLDSDDWIIRHAARTAIEHQPVERWAERALQEKRLNASIEAAMAIARTADRPLADRLLKRLLEISSSKLQLSQLWGLCQCYSLLVSYAPAEVAAVAERIVMQLESISPASLANVVSFGRCGNSVKVQGELAVLMSDLQADAKAIAIALPLLSRPEQEAQLHGLYAARRSKIGWDDRSRRLYFAALNEGENYLRGEGMSKFLTQIRDEATATLSQTERTELADILTAKSNATLDSLVPSNRPLQKQWTMNDLLPFLSDNSRQPDLRNGQRVFKEALCSACHRAGARGPAVGPDLTHVSSRFSRRDILLSIVEPSQVVAENYRNLKIATTDGRTIVGRAIMEGDYRSETLRIATNSLRPAEIIELSKSDIESSVESTVSPMPSGLLDTFQPQEILDLLEYLVSGTAL